MNEAYIDKNENLVLLEKAHVGDKNALNVVHILAPLAHFIHGGGAHIQEIDVFADFHHDTAAFPIGFRRAMAAAQESNFHLIHPFKKRLI